MIKLLRPFVAALTLALIFAGTASAFSNSLLTILVEDKGVVSTYKTDKKTIGEFLDEQNIILEDKDVIDLPLTDSVAMPDLAGDTPKKITIHRGVYVSLEFLYGSEVIKSETIKVEKWLPASVLVERLTDERKIKYALEDLAPEHPLVSGQIVRLIEVGKVVDTRTLKSAVKAAEPQAVKPQIFEEEELVELPFETIFELSFDIEGGTEIISQEGQNGQKKIIYLITKNENEITSEIISEEVIKEPVDRIILAGMGGTLEPDPEKFAELTPVTMSASAYTSQSTGKKQGSKGYGRTATGMEVAPGIVAVDPDFIPLGTKLYIEGYGYALAADTGGSIKGNKIDLFFESLSEALEFGRRDVIVYILD